MSDFAIYTHLQRPELKSQLSTFGKVKQSKTRADPVPSTRDQLGMSIEQDN
jgi:hypothetical protein